VVVVLYRVVESALPQPLGWTSPLTNFRDANCRIPILFGFLQAKKKPMAFAGSLASGCPVSW
jgi:hypothetical protein